ncbi:UNVERIFIED_CONTAM: Retrovirus-related Pol polyprotein from transposon.6 [Sesamum latifolium]|uniref:Retrovirus-related Pol polyprotein from transposon.6 n=1 Tax=Sesamum latifolium TaxID=2727402 RepID=A0AAW2TN12_9LAMI
MFDVMSCAGIATHLASVGISHTMGLPPNYAQILQMAFQAQAQFFAQIYAPAPTAPVAQMVPTIHRNYERIRKMGATEFEVATQEDCCYRFEQGLRPEIKRGLAIRISNFKILVELAVRMEEEVAEDKKKGEEKKKSSYIRGESSRLTKRGNGRSFSDRGGSFSQSGFTSRGNGGSRFSGPVGFNRGSTERSVSGGVAPGTQSQGSMGSSGPGIERARSRGRGTNNRNGSHTIGRSTSGTGTQSTLGHTQARIYHMTKEEAPASKDVILGTILVFDVEAYALIDPSFTHSYISSKLASKIPDLVVMDLRDFDVILGMDWLSQNKAIVECYNKEVVIESSGEPKVVFVGDRQVMPVCVISAIEARRLILEGCEAYLANVIDTKMDIPTLQEIPIMINFPEVFPDDLPVLPPQREVGFTIETFPGVAPISISPYRIAPIKLRELKKKIEELLEKRFIRLSTSPWGAPVLFVKKKDGSMRNREEHEQYLRIVLQTLKEKELYAKLSKCEFWVNQVVFLEHVISGDGIMPDPAKVKAIMG